MLFAFNNQRNGSAESRHDTGECRNSAKNDVPNPDERENGGRRTKCIIKRELIWQDTARPQPAICRWATLPLNISLTIHIVKCQFSHIRVCFEYRESAPAPASSTILINSIICQPNWCHISQSPNQWAIVSKSIPFQYGSHFSAAVRQRSTVAGSTLANCSSKWIWHSKMHYSIQHTHTHTWSNDITVAIRIECTWTLVNGELNEQPGLKCLYQCCKVARVSCDTREREWGFLPTLQFAIAMPSGKLQLPVFGLNESNLWMQLP